MNNNYNPYQSSGQHGLPKPTFSGTLGSGDNDNQNKRSLSDEEDEQYDPKRQRLPESNNQGYYNNVNGHQQYNPYYNQPYMYGNATQSYNQGYNQPYFQGYPMPVNPPTKQSYIGYTQQSSMYDGSPIVKTDNSQLTSYEDMYSDKKMKPIKDNKNRNNENKKKKKSQTSPTNKVSDKPKLVVELDDDNIASEVTSFKTSVKEEEASSPIEKTREDEEDDVNENNEDLEDNEKTDKSEVVTVPGTSISLVTDEDIAKWREERKKMWLLKISNRKEQHREAMGIKEEEVSSMGNVLKESKKERQFIQSIQNQVNRFNPKVNLNLKIVQREMIDDNTKLLSFIKELGDAGLLEYELSEKEKSVLFGNQDENNKFNNRRNDRFKGKRSSYNNNGNNRNYKNYRNKNLK